MNPTGWVAFLALPQSLLATVDLATRAGLPRARAWAGDLETVAARTGMNEMLVRAQFHRAALGDARAGETARLFADRIDNPAVLRRVTALESPAALAATPS